MPRSIHIAVSMLAVTACSLTSVAQPASRLIEGRVVRGSSSAPVGGANVVLAGTLYGTVTDDNGEFSLGMVRPGRYMLHVSMRGLAAIERTLIVPDDLEGELLVRLEAARAELTADPLLYTAEALGTVQPAPARGDPYLPDRGTRWSRIPGIGVMRFGPAYSYPVVRGLSGARTGTLGAVLPSPTLELPAVGLLDFGTIVASERPISVVDDPIVSPILGDALVGLVSDSRAGPNMVGREAEAEGEVGYQSNAGALSTKLSGRVRRRALRIAGAGVYASGGNYTTGDGAEWNGSFRHGGLVLYPEAVVSERSRIVGAARVARVGRADLPGAGVELAEADHSGVGAGWTVMPEGRFVRRTDVTLGWTRSRAELAGVEVDTAAAESWIAMDTDVQSLRATAVVDLYLPAVDRLQSGVTVTDTDFDWYGDRPSVIGSVPTTQRVSVSNRRLRVSPFVALGREWGRMDVQLAGRFDAVRSEASGESPAGERSTSWNFRPGVAARLAFLPQRRWELAVTLSAGQAALSVAAVSRIAIPVTSRLPSVSVMGAGAAASERVYHAGLRLSRKTDRSVVAVSSFLVAINGFLTPVRTSAGEFAITGTNARILGVELMARRELLPFVSVSGFAAYHRGRNSTVDEPLPMVMPFHGRVDLTASAIRGRILFEVSAEFAAAQDRVALSLGEAPAEGYAAFHLWFGIPLGGWLSMKTGVYNLFDAAFAPQAHVFDAARGERLGAPGRSWLISLNVRA